MTYDNEAIVRQAYHAAEGTVMDIAGFVGSFAGDGVINLGHSGVGEDADNVGGMGVMPDFASAVAAPVAEPKPQAFMSGDS